MLGIYEALIWKNQGKYVVNGYLADKNCKKGV